MGDRNDQLTWRKCNFGKERRKIRLHFAHFFLQMRMMASLLHLCVASITILPSVSQPPTIEWYDILQQSHTTACIPEGSDCRGLPPRFPRDTDNIIPAHNLGRLPRESFDPLRMKRNPGVCCGFCSCNYGCIKHGSCCLSLYESLSHGRMSTENTK